MEAVNILIKHGKVPFECYQDVLHLHIPILAMTADVIHATHEECLRCGMDGYVSKPFEGNSCTGKYSTKSVMSPQKEKLLTAFREWKVLIQKKVITRVFLYGTAFATTNVLFVE
ncbi:Histidine kinase [Musa troglodytarum]|uniref:Histidine kinase n=1 Tax=Musa troglodytarum TaxID=320322 RepID=A0A9E7JW17_9LILI|nr:Histidine kinase [Musa troglodytarum]